MTPTARREVELRVNVVADPARASAAMRALAAELDKVEKGASRASREVGKVGGGQRPGFADAAAQTLGAGSGAGFLGKVGIAAAAAATVIEFSAAMSKLASTTADARTKITALIDTVPLIGPIVSGVVNRGFQAYSFLTDPQKYLRDQEMAESLPGDLARIQLQGGLQLRNQGRGREGLAATQAAMAARALPTIASGGAGDFLAGRRTFDAMLYGRATDLVDPRLPFTSMAEASDPRTRAAAEARRLAERDATAAVFENAGAIRGVDQARPTADSAVRQLAQYSARTERERVKSMDDPSNRENFQGAAVREMKALEAATKELAALEDRVNAAKEKGLALAQAESRVRKSEIEVLRTRAGILAEQEQKARDKTMAFGAMDEVQRRALGVALQDFQRGGERGINADQRSLLLGSSLTQDFVSLALQKNVQNDPTLKEIFRITQQREQEDLRQERKKVTAELDVKVQIDDEILKTQIKNIVAAILKELKTLDNIKNVDIAVRRQQINAQVAASQ